jgi:hypothetical protein
MLRRKQTAREERLLRAGALVAELQDACRRAVALGSKHRLGARAPTSGAAETRRFWEQAPPPKRSRHDERLEAWAREELARTEPMLEKAREEVRRKRRRFKACQEATAALEAQWRSARRPPTMSYDWLSDAKITPSIKYLCFVPACTITDDPKQHRTHDRSTTAWTL